MRRTLFAVLALWSATGVAQTMYKCLDAGNRVTYSNLICEKQGLRDAGPVQDRVTSMPFTKPAPKPAPGTLPTVRVPVPAESAAPPAAASPAAAASAPAVRDDANASRGSTTQVKPVVPLLERLAK